MPWTVFGIRGPGGSRTASVVAVAISFPVSSLVVPVLKVSDVAPSGRRFGRGNAPHYR